jgi:uncharacterized membrane protein YbaN (DUF454 family)
MRQATVPRQAADAVRPRARASRSGLTKCLLRSVGVLAVGLGVVGIFVPLLPTTPFLLLAAACFARSSDRFYRWLINHRWLGSYVRNYREHRATTRTVKATSITLLWASIGYASVVVVRAWPVRALLLVIAVGVTAHLLSLGTLTEEMIESTGETNRGKGRWQTRREG